MDFSNGMSVLVTCLTLLLGVAGFAIFVAIMQFDDHVRRGKRELEAKLTEVIMFKKTAKEKASATPSVPVRAAIEKIEKMPPSSVGGAIVAALAGDKKAK